MFDIIGNNVAFTIQQGWVVLSVLIVSGWFHKSSDQLGNGKMSDNSAK